MATIFRADRCAFTKVPSLIRSAKAYEEIDNGVPVELDGLADGQREIFSSKAVSDSSKDFWIVTTPELMYDETPRKYLEDFINKKDSTMRVCKLLKGDIFSITGDKITGTPDLKTSDGLAPAAGGWTSSASADTDFAKLIAVENVAGKTIYVYEVL